MFKISTKSYLGVVVKALRYYSDGLGIDSRWCYWGFFSVAPSDGTMCPGVDSAVNYFLFDKESYVSTQGRQFVDHLCGSS